MMFSIKHWIVESVVELAATFVLDKIRFYVPELFKTSLENEWKFTDCLKKMSQCLLKKSLISVLSNLASIILQLKVGEVFLNMPCCSRRKKRFSKPIAVVVL